MISIIIKGKNLKIHLLDQEQICKQEFELHKASPLLEIDMNKVNGFGKIIIILNNLF